MPSVQELYELWAGDSRPAGGARPEPRAARHGLAVRALRRPRAEIGRASSSTSARATHARDPLARARPARTALDPLPLHCDLARQAVAEAGSDSSRSSKEPRRRCPSRTPRSTGSGAATSSPTSTWSLRSPSSSASSSRAEPRSSTSRSRPTGSSRAKPRRSRTRSRCGSDRRGGRSRRGRCRPERAAGRASRLGVARTDARGRRLGRAAPTSCVSPVWVAALRLAGLRTRRRRRVGRSRSGASTNSWGSCVRPSTCGRKPPRPDREHAARRAVAALAAGCLDLREARGPEPDGLDQGPRRARR